MIFIILVIKFLDILYSKKHVNLKMDFKYFFHHFCLKYAFNSLFNLTKFLAKNYQDFTIIKINYCLF